MGGTDGVGVSGEVDVDFILRDDAGLAAAGAAALDAENRPQSRLSQVDHRAIAQAAQALGQADGSGSFALAGRGGGDAGDYHQFAGGLIVDGIKADFGLVAAVGDEVFPGYAETLGYQVNGIHRFATLPYPDGGYCAILGRGLPMGGGFGSPVSLYPTATAWPVSEDWRMASTRRCSSTAVAKSGWQGPPLRMDWPNR